MVTNEVFQELEAEQRRVFEAIIKALNPPGDAPGFARVLSMARDCCFAWAETLTFSTQKINALILAVDQVTNRIEEMLPVDQEETSGMCRRFSKYPVWAMLLTMNGKDENRELMAGVGAALMLALGQGKKPPKELFIKARRWLQSSRRDSMPAELIIQLVRATKRACRFFLNGQVAVMPLEDELRLFFANKKYFATDRSHQGLADHRAQSSHQMLISAEKIRQGVENCVHDDILAALSFCCGLTVRLTVKLPLVRRADKDNLVGLDLADGYFWIHLKLITPNHATLADDVRGALIEADEIICKPLPEFITTALRELSRQFPGASCLADILPYADVSTYRILLDEGEIGKLKPTVTRFRNGAGPFALELGLERTLAALVSGDFRLVPHGRLYYVAIESDALHEGCSRLYESLGWGSAVPRIGTGHVGSQVVPCDKTICNWAAWMAEQVRCSTPGRNSSLARLVLHHNIFAKVTASFAVFALVLRERKFFPIDASDLSLKFDYIAFGDKLVGQNPGKELIPVCGLLQRQFEFYFVHIEALSRRLEKRVAEDSDRVRQHISSVLQRKSVPLFFMLGEDLQCIPIGSRDLSDWWPDEFRLVSNFGRHFWQTHASGNGIQNTGLDAFVRHSQRGHLAWSAGSLLSVSPWAERLRSSMDAKISELGIQPIPGLSSRVRS